LGANNRGYRLLILALATFGGVGFLPLAPGTWGTLAALPLWYYLAHFGPWGYGLGVAALIILGLGVAGPAQDLLRRPDHSAIVIDEVAGLLITLAGVPITWHNVAAGFIIFRILDIIKPPPIRWMEAGPASGLSVMADDVVAGVIGRVIMEIFIVIFRGGG
jgi:phosphatidylglycerophosphatase A